MNYWFSVRIQRILKYWSNFFIRILEWCSELWVVFHDLCNNCIYPCDYCTSHLPLVAVSLPYCFRDILVDFLKGKSNQSNNDSMMWWWWVSDVGSWTGQGISLLILVFGSVENRKNNYKKKHTLIGEKTNFGPFWCTLCGHRQGKSKATLWGPLMAISSWLPIL